jgi:hypothetical protein
MEIEMVYNKNFIAVVKVRGKVLRESNDGTVRIPFGSEYTILLKNKNSQKALVNIEINGDDALSDNQIIVHGNSDVELEGFMNDDGDVENKFKFIEKTAEISDFRGDDPEDGMIRISYRFEQRYPTLLGGTIWRDSPQWPGGNHVYYSSHTQTIGSSKCFGASLTSSNAEPSITANCCLTSSPEVSSIETDLSVSNDDGLTVAGSESGQSFNTGYIGALETEEYVICLQLKGGNPITGRVKKPVYVQTKIQCTSCGRKHRSNKSFCSNCGTALKKFA